CDRGAGQPALKPTRALRSRAVREGFRHYIALGPLLQGIVAHRSRRAQRRLDVALLEDVVSLIGVTSPDSREAIRLQLHAHLQLIDFGFRGAFLTRSHLRLDA